MQKRPPPGAARPSRRFAYRREEVLELFADAVRELGEDVTQAQFVRFASMSERPIIRLFGSWADLRATAGLGPSRSRLKSRRYTREVILEKLRECIASQGPDLSLEEFLDETGMSYRTLSRWFRGWRNLREAAGLPRISSRPHGNCRYDEQTILRALRVFAVSPTGPKTQSEFCRRTRISPQALLSRFGSWTRAWQAAGLSAPQTRRRYSDKELLDEYLRVRKMYRRPLRSYDFQRYSTMRWETLVRWLGDVRTIEKRARAQQVRDEAVRRGLIPPDAV